MMYYIAHLGVLFLLISLTESAADCKFGGKTLKHLDTTPHENGCAIVQCQFGKIETYYEACGKEIDGQCNRLNYQFLLDGNTYECTKVPKGDGFEYKYNIAIAKPATCDDEGKVYAPWAKFKRSDNCREYQCQNGLVFPLEPVCPGDIDGKCHLVGETFEKGTTTYVCTVRQEGDVNYYENKVSSTTPSLKRSCSGAGQTYAHLEIFQLPGTCDKRQCQDKNMKVLTRACNFKDTQTCYPLGEQWRINNKTYQCETDPATGSAKIVFVDKGFEKCKRGERWYGQLEIYTRPEGCNSVQCQNGKTQPVEEGCIWNIDNACYKLNYVWEAKGQFQKCILTGDGLYRVVEVDSNGKIIEKVPTATAPPDLGEMCPEAAADLIFIWDSSGSISRGNYQNQKDASCNIVSAFRIGPNNVRVGGVIFSNTVEKVFDLDTYNDVDSLCKAIQKTPFLGDETETQKSFNLVVDDQMFSPAHGGRTDVIKICIIITDGRSTDTAITIAAADRLKAVGVQIMVVGVGVSDQGELEGMASTPKNVFKPNGYGALLSLRNEISKRTCNANLTLKQIMMEFGGIWPNETNKLVQIAALADADEPKLLECSMTVADVIFVIDSSASLANDYAETIDLVVNLTTTLTISPQYVQTGAILISTKETKLYDLNTYSTKAAVIQALDAAQFLGGDRRTDSAIDSILTEGLFTSSHGGRDKAARVAVVIQAGPSVDPSRVLTLSKTLRNQGTRVIAVGINEYDFKELVGLTGSKDYVFAAPSLKLLKFVKGSLYKKLCDATKLPRPGPEPPRCSDTWISPCDQNCTDTDTAYECSCLRGFVVNKKDKNKCDDIDECTGTSHGCTQVCVNTPGNYECACKPGYEFSEVNKAECIEIDECLRGDPCQHLCENTPGSYKCSCKPGFEVSPDDPNSCIDIDECKNPTTCQQNCTNSVGSYECSCNTGYVVSPTDSSKCDDVDECTEKSPCQHTCTNKPGSYSCACNPGYQVSTEDPNKCDDVDECKDPSTCEHKCTNSVGSYECSCNAGYVVSPTNPSKCDDVDECKEKSPCQHTCSNTPGSYSCACNPGFQISATDPNKCDDVDECSKDSPCQQLCTNTESGFSCSCRPGYVISPTDPNKCDDVDECQDPTKCEQKCTNSVGSYECSCNTGYAVSETDSSKCNDVDECTEKSPCQHTCSNTPGSFSCSCRPGYQISTEDPNKCDDVDECKDPATCQQKCTNSVGSYECSCNTGYAINPTDSSKCDDVDECSTKSPCQQICANTVSGYTCSCKPGYVISSTDPNKCDDIDECLDVVNPPCHHICTNNDGGYSCSCRNGYAPNPCDTSICKDVDECENNPCAGGNPCTNTRGGYTCA